MRPTWPSWAGCRRCGCSSSAPRRSGRASPSTPTTRRASSTCADGSTGCRWPWSWRRPGPPSSSPPRSSQRLGDALSMLGGRRRRASPGTRRCAAPSSGATTCSPSRRRSCCAGCRCSAGGFTLAAVEAVCGDRAVGPRGPARPAGHAWSTSRWWSRRRPPPGSRYRQLETVRQFGSENLDRAGETAQLSAAHCAYFLAFAVAHNPERATGVVIEQPKAARPRARQPACRAALVVRARPGDRAAARRQPVALLVRPRPCRRGGALGRAGAGGGARADPAARRRPDRPDRPGQPAGSRRPAPGARRGGAGDRAADRRTRTRS